MYYAAVATVILIHVCHNIFLKWNKELPGLIGCIILTRQTTCTISESSSIWQQTKYTFYCIHFTIRKWLDSTVTSIVTIVKWPYNTAERIVATKKFLYSTVGRTVSGIGKGFRPGSVLHSATHGRYRHRCGPLGLGFKPGKLYRGLGNMERQFRPLPICPECGYNNALISSPERSVLCRHSSRWHRGSWLNESWIR